MENKIVVGLSFIFLLIGGVITHRFLNRGSATNVSDQLRESHNLMWERIRHCDQDSDCTLVGGPCGEAIGINKFIEIEAKSFFREIMPAIDCAEPDPNRPKPTSTVCRNHFCTEIIAQPGAPPDANSGRR